MALQALLEELLRKSAKPRGGKAIIALTRKFLGITYRTLKNRWVFAEFPNFVLAEECGKPKTEARNLGEDKHYRRRKWAHLMGR